jgi:hypothetical protein
MLADADHEVIDSPEALFRHLYEEHGVSEARDLDPETAPLQFWLRRHADLERAQLATHPARQPNPPPDPPAPPSRPREAARPQPAAPPPSSGRRPAGFGDPLVEAVARALAGRGHGEAAVRSAMRSFAGEGGAAGEAAVRAVFVEPMLQAVAERLLGAPPPKAAGWVASPTPPPPQAAAPPPRRRTDPEPEAAGPAPPPAPGREEPVRPEAAWAVLWADLGESVRRPGDGTATGGDGDDLMAVANAVQARRRVRMLRR